MYEYIPHVVYLCKTEKIKNLIWSTESHHLTFCITDVGLKNKHLQINKYIRLRLNFNLNLSHLSAHMVTRLLRENRNAIPKLLSVKKLLKTVAHQIFSLFFPVS